MYTYVQVPVPWQVMPAISYDDNESNLLDPVSDESDGDSTEDSSKAAPRVASNGAVFARELGYCCEVHCLVCQAVVWE